MKVAMLLEFFERKVLVVGGGKVAYRKAQRLYEAQAQVSCIALTYVPSFAEAPWECKTKAFEAVDLEGMNFVVAATHDAKVNQEIVNLCKEKGLLSHCVQQEVTSDFSFMVQDKVHDLLIACSTDGKAPGFSKIILEKMIASLEESDFERFDIIANLREQILKSNLQKECLRELYHLSLEELRERKERYEKNGLWNEK
ncbi:MAG: hypothetical protein JW708_07675 [Vallitaleaceae bacterium]|nr:hypothetical protein [Vallitaleaceae bacterium]